MKRYIVTLISFLLVMPILAQLPSRRVVKVGDFNDLHLIDNVNVDYRCNSDSAGLVVLHATQQMADLFILNNNGKGKLSIQTATEAINVTGLPTLTVYSTGLTSAENSGDSTLTLHGLKPMDKFTITLGDNGQVLAAGIHATTLDCRIFTGNGLIQVTGQCSQLKTKLVGTGTIDAEHVQARAVQCRMTGTGTVRCTLNGGELNVRGSGAGRVYYHGKPSKVVVHKLGSLKAIALDTDQPQK
ncbi:MAG: DUF2807 domain-containing protein [Muribaculaceae bacterium]|nr:DUF2807 domain-containing protein [Muribaculaceae bacterium]